MPYAITLRNMSAICANLVGERRIGTAGPGTPCVNARRQQGGNRTWAWTRSWRQSRRPWPPAAARTGVSRVSRRASDADFTGLSGDRALSRRSPKRDSTDADGRVLAPNRSRIESAPVRKSVSRASHVSHHARPMQVYGAFSIACVARMPHPAAIGSPAAADVRLDPSAIAWRRTPAADRNRLSRQGRGTRSRRGGGRDLTGTDVAARVDHRACDMLEATGPWNISIQAMSRKRTSRFGTT